MVRQLASSVMQHHWVDKHLKSLNSGQERASRAALDSSTAYVAGMKGKGCVLELLCPGISMHHALLSLAPHQRSLCFYPIVLTENVCCCPPHQLVPLGVPAVASNLNLCVANATIGCAALRLSKKALY